MGQEISTSEDHDSNGQSSGTQFEFNSHQFELIGMKNNDDRYGGEIQIYKNLVNGKVYVQKNLVFDEEERYETEKKLQHEQSVLYHENLANIQESKFFETKNFCSHHYTIQYYLDYFKQDLSLQISENKKNKAYFTEAGIVKMISSVVSALKYLHDKNYYHGKIQPKTIFITDNLNFKIANNQFLTQRTSYQSLIMKSDTSVFLCPQLFQQLCNKVLQPYISSKEKSDVFSLGLVALQMATNANIDQIYNHSDGSIKVDQLNLLLSEVNENLSLKLFQTLNKMLEIRDEERYTFQQVLEQLKNDSSDNNINKANNNSQKKANQNTDRSFGNNLNHNQLLQSPVSDLKLQSEYTPPKIYSTENQDHKYQHQQQQQQFQNLTQSNIYQSQIQQSQRMDESLKIYQPTPLHALLNSEYVKSHGQKNESDHKFNDNLKQNVYNIHDLVSSAISKSQQLKQKYYEFNNQRKLDLNEEDDKDYDVFLYNTVNKKLPEFEMQDSSQPNFLQKNKRILKSVQEKKKNYVQSQRNQGKNWKF